MQRISKLKVKEILGAQVNLYALATLNPVAALPETVR